VLWRSNIGGESVAIDVLGVKAGGVGGFGEGNRVIPTGTGWDGLGGALKKDAKGGSTRPERGGDPGGEPVAGGGTEHEDLLGAAGERGLGLYVGDPFLDMGVATGGVRGDANEATDFGFDDQRGKSVAAAAGGASFAFRARRGDVARGRGRAGSGPDQDHGTFCLGTPPLRSRLTANLATYGNRKVGMEHEAGFACAGVDAEDTAVDGYWILRIDDPELGSLCRRRARGVFGR